MVDMMNITMFEKSSIKVHPYHIFGLNVARNWQNKFSGNLNCGNLSCGNLNFEDFIRFDFKPNFKLLWLTIWQQTYCIHLLLG